MSDHSSSIANYRVASVVRGAAPDSWLIWCRARAALLDTDQSDSLDSDAGRDALQVVRCILVSIAQKIVRKREDAEDVAQVALCRAIQKKKTLRSPAAFKPWLCQITRRMALNYIASSHFKRILLAADLVANDSPVSSVLDRVTDDADLQLPLSKSDFEIVTKAIECLSEAHRNVLILSYLEGYGERDISLRERVPIGTVRSRKSQARRRLREALIGIGWNDQD